MERSRFLLSGSGGQGVITMAILLAEAAALHEGRIAVQSQSYGPEARGGATRSDVIISDSPIFFPKVTQPNVLVALTAEAGNKYAPFLRPGGLYVYDTAFLRPRRNVDAELRGLGMHEAVMATTGKAQTYNICVLGVLCALTGAVSPASVRKSLDRRFPEQFHSANNAALDLGVELARTLTKRAV